MPTIYAITAVLVSFFTTLFVLPYWIKRARDHNLVGVDMHKLDKRPVSELGGLVTIFSAVVGILFAVAMYVFFYIGVEIISLLAASLSILIALIIGLVDDILGWKLGLRQYQKAVISLLIALPMIVVNAGVRFINIPFNGIVDFGKFYPLFLVPLGIIGSSNAFNMIAGFNGLEAGMGIIILSTLGYIAWVAGSNNAALIASCIVASLIAFFMFNKRPAIVFPGDTLTYSVGASIGVIAITGNVEKFALIMFIPYFIELLLKLRGRFQKESFGKLLSDGTLTNRYDKWYSLTHVAISLQRRLKGKATEDGVVLMILGCEAILAVVTVFYFFG